MWATQSLTRPRKNKRRPNFRRPVNAASRFSFEVPGALTLSFQRWTGISASSAFTAFAYSLASSILRSDSSCASPRTPYEPILPPLLLEATMVWRISKNGSS